MAEDFKNIVNKQGSSELQAIYNEIIQMLKDDIGPDVDIEAIFSVIDGLQGYSIENIGELSIYISKFFDDTPLHKNNIISNFLLNKELQYNKVWIVVGYSFRDPVIQNIFSNNFKDGKKMILIHLKK
jgi:hypothetical protein